MSLADQGADTIRKSISSLGYYNLQAGPVVLRFQGDMGFEYNNNVNLTQSNPQSDFILRPMLNMRALWPVTAFNSVTLNLGIGYSYYLKTKNLDSLFITPGSNLAFVMYTGDFIITFHNRMSLVNDVAQAPTVAGTGNYETFEETLGVVVDWKLNELTLTFGYNHDLMTSLSSTFTDIDHNSDIIYARAGLAINPSTKVGLELGGAATEYTHDVFNNDMEINAGPFYQAKISDYLTARATAGFVRYMFSSGGLGATPDQNDYYADVSITHRVNQWWSQSLSGGRQDQAGTISDLVGYFYARYAAIFKLTHQVTATARFTYELGTDTGGTTVGQTEEVFDLYHPSLSVACQITEKLGATLGYDFLRRNSNLPLGYTQNRVILDLKYNF